MGPRSINRGNGQRPRSGGADQQASMGPRSIERGNPVWKLWGVRSVQASMGPRSIERGNAGVSPKIISQFVLQWGRAQSSAEITPIPDGIVQIQGLQWGRAQSSAEMRGDLRLLIAGSRASMGPRSIERGNLEPSFMPRWDRRLQWGRAQSSAEINKSGWRDPQHKSASMGPRSIERGNDANPAVDRVGVCRFNGAALNRARKYRLIEQIECLLDGFNGAALNRARKYSSRSAADRRLLLQWGRAQSSAEIQGSLPLPSTRSCFNGAALNRARKCLAATAKTSERMGFNGAALNRARKWHPAIVFNFQTSVGCPASGLGKNPLPLGTDTVSKRLSVTPHTP
jgi:hypothetical protein